MKKYLISGLILGSLLIASPVIAAPDGSFVSPQTAADKYSWSIKFEVWDSQGQVDAGKAPHTELHSGGPFTTSSACVNDDRAAFAAFQKKHNDAAATPGVFDIETPPLCSCDSTVASQGAACPGYTAPTAQPITSGGTPPKVTVSGQTCFDVGCPDINQVCKGNPPTCQSNSAACNPACSGTTPICVSGKCEAVDPSTGTYTDPNATSNGTTAGGGVGSFVPLAPIPGLTQGVVANSSGLVNFINNLYKYLIGLAGALAVIYIIWGGIEISTQDSVSKKSDGRARIENAVLGLVLVLSPVIVFGVINPAILDLSFNLPPLDTKSGVGTDTGSGSGATTGAKDTATGCTVTGKAPYLQVATCPSEDAATKWEAANSSCSGRLRSECGASNSNGCTNEVVTCEGESSDEFVLMNVGGSNLLSSAILQPLASQSNAADFAKFHQGCNAAGGSMCTNYTAFQLGNTGDCSSYTTPLPAGKSGSCKITNLSCYTQADAEDANDKLSMSINSNAFHTCEPRTGYIDTPYK